MTAQHILVAFDFSAPARRALAMASQLARTLGASLDVVHVHVDPFAYTPAAGGESLWKTSEELESHMKRMREHLEETLAHDLEDDVQARPHVLQGDCVPKILDLAREVGADLLVTGTTGKTGIERVLMGSTAEKLVRHASFPVLTVH